MTCDELNFQNGFCHAELLNFVSDGPITVFQIQHLMADVIMWIVDIVRLACRKSLTFSLIKYVRKCWLLRCQLIWLSLESRSSMWFGIRLCSEWPVAINNAKNYCNRIFGCVYVGKPQFSKIHIKSAVTNRFAASHIRSSYK